MKIHVTIFTCISKKKQGYVIVWKQGQAYF